MALKPAISLLSIADPAASIVVQDSTGNYSGTNLGGFGAPNPLYADLAGVLLRLSSFKDLTTYSDLKLDAGQQAAFYGAGLTLAPESFALTSLFEDAVYDLKSFLLFPQVTQITFTAGSKQFTMAAASTVFADAVGFIIPALDGAKLYLIDRTKTLDGAGGWVTTALPSTGSPATVQVAYEGDLKIAVYKAGNGCLLRDLGIWSEMGCEGVNFRDVMKRYMMKISLEAKFSKGYVYDTHNLIVKLADYCDTTDCGC